jgi:hypothetical protein
MLAKPGTKWKVKLGPSVLGTANRSWIAYTGKGAAYKALSGEVTLLQYAPKSELVMSFHRRP